MPYKAHPVVDELAALIGGRGEPCEYGCDEEDVDTMLTRAREIYPGKPCCVVSHWCWADFKVGPEHVNLLRESSGLEPAFLYADRVIYDQARRFKTGSCVTTSFLVQFHTPCIFSTRNTSYILIGKGTRMSVSVEVYKQLIL